MRKPFVVLGVVALVIAAVVGCSKKEAAETTVTSADPISVGSAAPDFTTKAQDGREVHLAALKGKPVVLYFYPKDETPGCTKEAESFRDAFSKIESKGAVVIGVSGDTESSHKSFSENHKLPFFLVSDPDGKIAALYEVPFHAGFASRQTFVIDADGKLKNIHRSVDVSKHADEILAEL